MTNKKSDKKKGEIPIHELSIYEACEVGLKDKVSELLKKNSGLINVSQENESLLMIAARNGNLDLIKLLIDNNADINQKGYNDMTPLMLASKNGHVSVVKELIGNENIDINAVDIVCIFLFCLYINLYIYVS